MQEAIFADAARLVGEPALVPEGQQCQSGFGGNLCVCSQTARCREDYGAGTSTGRARSFFCLVMTERQIMRVALASVLLLVPLLAPIAANADDSDKDRSHPGAFVKDSVITTKIKAKLAAAKPSTLAHVRVDTDNKGVVELSGTAANQAEIDRAVAIARGVEGVVSVENHIQIAKEGAGAASTGDSRQRSERSAAPRTQ